MTGQLVLTAGAPRLPIPVLATRAFLSSSGARLGEIVPLPVGNANIPVRLTAQVRAFPVTGGTESALIIDQAWLQQALAAQSQPPLPVTAWWLGGGAAPRLAARRGHRGDRAGLAPGCSATRCRTFPRFAAGDRGGAGVVAASVRGRRGRRDRERRPQHALLAALGVGRAARAAQLCLEQLMLGVPAAAAGMVIGAALAYLLIPPVTLTASGNAPFPPVRVVIPLGWTALLALGIAAVPVVAAAAAGAYRPDPAAGLRAGEAGWAADLGGLQVTGRGCRRSWAALLVLVCVFVAVAVPRASLGYRTAVLQRSFRALSSTATTVLSDATISGLTGRTLSSDQLDSARVQLSAGLRRDGLPLAPPSAAWSGMASGSSQFTVAASPGTRAWPRPSWSCSTAAGWAATRGWSPGPCPAPRRRPSRSPSPRPPPAGSACTQVPGCWPRARPSPSRAHPAAPPVVLVLDRTRSRTRRCLPSPPRTPRPT